MSPGNDTHTATRLDGEVRAIRVNILSLIFSEYLDTTLTDS